MALLFIKAPTKNRRQSLGDPIHTDPEKHTYYVSFITRELAVCKQL